MKTYRTLKLSTLIEKRACADQVALFRKTFGESVRVTENLCLSVADKFDWAWAAENLLSPAALAEYDRVTAAAWAEYGRVTAATAAAWAEYGPRCRPDAYDRVTAPAFARGYLSC